MKCYAPLPESVAWRWLVKSIQFVVGINRTANSLPCHTNMFTVITRVIITTFIKTEYYLFPLSFLGLLNGIFSTAYLI